LIQYLFLDVTVLVSGCLSTCFWLLWLLRVFTVFFVVVTESFLVVALLQYSFLVVTVLFSGSNSTRFWLLQYSFLVATVIFLVVMAIVCGC
jgi:hypothetical protein